MPERVVYWAGRQWCVTADGLDTITGDYEIDAVALSHLTDWPGPPMAERLRHVSEKTWVDLEDFIAAFAVALQVHAGKFIPLPDGAFLEAVRSARSSKWANAQFEIVREERKLTGLDMQEATEIGDEVDRRLAIWRSEGGLPFDRIPDPAASADQALAETEQG